MASDFEKALAVAIEYVLVEKKFAEYGLEIDKSEAEYIESYAKYYWDNQDKTYYETNGVGYESYKELMTFRSKRSEIFDYYYNKKNAETGKGGLYAVPDADIIKALGENYILADTLTIDLVPSSETGITEYTKDQIATFKADIEKNVNKYNQGTSFAEIYKSVYGQEPQSNVNETEDLKTVYPKSAGVYSVNSNDVTLYNLLKNKTKEDSFKYETAYLVGSEADKVFSMAVIYDITKDPYYLEQYRSDILYLLKEEEFTAKLAEEGKALAVNKNTKLVDFYKPTNLDYDAAEEAAQQ